MCRPQLVISAIIAVTLTAGCRQAPEPKDTLYDCAKFEVYADSIVRGDVTYKAISPTEITNAWKTDSLPANMPVLSSPQKLAEALYNKGNCESPSFSPTEIYLSLAAIYPAESMDALRNRQSARDAAWAAAAWEVYCVTGDKKWLREAYEIITAQLRSTHTISQSQIPHLMRGVPTYLTPTDAFYPAWMEQADRLQTISAGANALRAHSHEIAAKMAEILHLYESEHRIAASASMNAINDNLWIPNLGYYGEYMYGDYYPILSHTTDNMANSLCILFGIATPEMAQSIMRQSPMLSTEVPMTYPAIKPGIEKSATLQALWGICAAKVRNETAMRAATGMIWDMAVDHPVPSQWQGLVMKGLFGMSFTPEGINMSPFVPSQFDGLKKIDNFRYRDAQLTIALQGTGDRIAGFMIDSVSCSAHTIPATLKGKHIVEITLSNNNLPTYTLPVSPDMTVPPTPTIQWTTSTDAKITDFVSGYSYGVYINGTFLEEIHEDTYAYSPTEPTVIDIVPIADNEYIGFAPRSHVIAPGNSMIIIPATSITPRRTPLHLIPHRETATNYIELAARHNTRITFYVNAPDDGSYFVNIGYSNGTTETGLRTLSVNGSDYGILVCPPGERNDWVTVHRSSTLTVPLKAGFNKLALTYIHTTLLLNKIILLKKQSSINPQ